MSSNFRYQPFVAVSGNLGGKIPLVDNFLSSDEQTIYPTTSVDENCIEFDFQTDRDYYVDLRQTCLALKLKVVKGRGYESDKTTEVKKDHKEEAKAHVETVAAEEEEQEVSVLFVTHVKKTICTHFFPMLKCTSTINKLQL